MGQSFPQRPPVGPPHRGHAPVRRPFSVLDAFGYGWERTISNFAPLAAVVLVFLMVGAVAAAATVLLLPRPGMALLNLYRGGAMSGVGMTALLLVTFWFVWAFLLQSVLARGAMALLEGAPRVPSSALISARGIGGVIGTAVVALAPTLLAIALSAAGSVVGGLGPILAILAFSLLPVQIAVLFLSGFAVMFAVKGLRPGKALNASWKLTSRHAIEVFKLQAISAICLLGGALLAGVGLLLAAPVVTFAQAYGFKTLRKRRIYD